MTPLVIQALRSRWFALCVHAGLWVLLFLAAKHFGAGNTGYRDSVALSIPAQSPVPVAKLERLFARGAWPKILSETNASTLFYTTHFIPAPKPAPAAPTTRKIELSYRGFSEARGQR